MCGSRPESSPFAVVHITLKRGMDSVGTDTVPMRISKISLALSCQQVDVITILS